MDTGGAVIGALRGVLILDTRDWSPAIGRARGDLSGLRGALEQVAGVMDEVAGKAKRMGAGLTAGITLPLGALAAVSNKTASGFEASMKRVEAALKGVSGIELKRLSDQARELGPRVGKGATEAADGIEALGLAGVGTADILGGALKASLNLAAAGAAPVSDAAALVTDAMGQFKVTAAQLPQVVGDVVGALDASKFGFVDFQQALAQGGGIAASAGINFRDFATAVAATSTQFSSGSDAGTSFKTYIQSLVPATKEAEFAMKKLGIEFFDVRTGRMKPLAEQAEILRKALAGLSDKSKTEALKNIFGSDAARTAIGLMEKGRQGIADLQREIAGGDVGAKIDKRLEGEAAATTRLANAFESVKIAIGEAGLTDMIARVKNGFAGFLESIAHAPPALLKVGVAVGAVAAALGPLAAGFGLVASFVLAKVARGFGLIGWAISAVIEPIGTLGAALIRLVAQAGIREGLALIGRSILGITGPIGWAIAAVLLFKDSILTALDVVWQQMQATLGGPLAALWDKAGALIGGVVNGPIGNAIGGLVALIQGVLDVVGTLIAGIVEMIGSVLVAGLEIAIRAITGVVDVVADVVRAVSALLTGDFAGAWQAAYDAVDKAIQTVIDIITMAVPGLTAPLQAIYAAAKAWLADGFASIAQMFSGVVSGAIDWFASAMPGVVATAKSVYEGVKSWLVDKFGGIAAWIGSTAKWIGDQYAGLKARLGFGAAAPAGPAGAPPAPKPEAPAAPTGGTRTVDFTPPKTTRAKGGGASHRFDGANREQLKIEAELEAARARGDKEAEKRIQDQLALSKQVEAYQRTGLSLDQARAAAQRDMTAIQQARAVSVAREVADEQASAALDAARLGSDQQTIEALERQADLKRRIATYYELTKNLAEATRLAEADQAKVDAARAQVRQRWFEDDAREQAVRIAQARGDSEERIRQLQREIDIRRRARELEQNGGMSSGEAMTRAATEWDQENRARLIGNVRATFQEGIRAALDGNLGDFMKNWWKDRVAKGMEEAINSLADLVSRLFANIGKGSGGGGILGKVGSFVGTLLGGGINITPGMLGVPDLPTSLPQMGKVWADLPKFATGGSFRVGGMSGIDNNLIAFRATKGEMVDIRKPGNDNGGAGSVMVVPSPYFDVVAASAAEPSIQRMGVRAAMGGSEMATSRAAKASRRRIAR
ncbi:phage tail tape measure protein [Sphingomonas ginsenosidimutans]|uniref:Phage tail tape measure protein n=1 Tax=Sphingomonas ginsenosidimutans TaxID=862134 RepID=A0A2A4I0E2_9SPHN|nr:phage tail tape measure protein [Sphingomonas ginsenosidimutans]PCG09649.1 phage tail tape measure protein [Sphingomonas ginsenosidimutans]